MDAYAVVLMDLSTGEERVVYTRANSEQAATDRLFKRISEADWMHCATLSPDDYRTTWDGDEFLHYTEDDSYWERKEYEQLDHHAHVTDWLKATLQLEDVPF